MNKIESIKAVRCKENGEIKTVLGGFCDGCFDDFEPTELKNFKHLDGMFLCPRCYKEKLGEKVLDESSLQTLVMLLENYADCSEEEFYREWFSNLGKSEQSKILKDAFRAEFFTQSKEESERFLRNYLKQDTDFLKEISKTRKEK